MIQAVVSAGSSPVSGGALATITVPGGSGTGLDPKLVTDRQPPGRPKCSTCPLPGIHSRVSAPCNRCRKLSACWYSARVEAGSRCCSPTLSGPNQSGCGRCAVPPPNPNEGPSAVHG